MIQLITIGLTAAVGIISIIKWLGSYKRKREARKREIERLIKHGEKSIAEALDRNDTLSISRLTEQLRKLRGEYRALSKKK